MARDTKQRMVEAAALLFRRRGLAATSFTDVLAATDTARGVIYHHFPGGKDDLAEQAVAWTGRRVRSELEGLGADDQDAVLREFIEHARDVVTKAADGTSCAVAAVTAEATPARGRLAAAADRALRSWIETLEARLREAGMPSKQARATAALMIAFLEGSLVLARATAAVDIFDDSAAALLDALATNRV